MLFFKSYLHFGHMLHFFGCWFLARFHRSIEIWPHLSLIQKILLASWFWHVLIWYFQGMRSSNVDLEMPALILWSWWIMDATWVSYPVFLTFYKHVWVHRHIFQCIFHSLHSYIYLYINCFLYRYFYRANGLACARRFVSLVPVQPLSVTLRGRGQGKQQLRASN